MTCVYINGKINGELHFNYYNTKIVSRYIDGKKEGKTKWFLDNKRFMECDFINDKLEGYHRVYYPYLNQILMECEYKNNNRNGRYRKYYNCGLLDVDCMYINGKKDGKFIRLYNNSKIDTE